MNKNVAEQLLLETSGTKQYSHPVLGNFAQEPSL